MNAGSSNQLSQEPDCLGDTFSCSDLQKLSKKPRRPVDATVLLQAL